jgi:hypothetical protein
MSSGSLNKIFEVFQSTELFFKASRVVGVDFGGFRSRLDQFSMSPVKAGSICKVSGVSGIFYLLVNRGEGVVKNYKITSRSIYQISKFFGV